MLRRMYRYRSALSGRIHHDPYNGTIRQLVQNSRICTISIACTLSCKSPVKLFARGLPIAQWYGSSYGIASWYPTWVTQAKPQLVIGALGIGDTEGLFRL